MPVRQIVMSSTVCRSTRQKLHLALGCVGKAEECRAARPRLALLLLRLAERVMASAGTSSPAVLRTRGQVLAGMDRPAAALRALQEALLLDPLDLATRTLRDQAVTSARSHLLGPARPVGDRELAELYHALLAADCAGVDVHLAVASRWAERGELTGARDLVTAVLTLHPARREAWELLGRIARDQGDLPLARHAESEAAAGTAPPRTG